MLESQAERQAKQAAVAQIGEVIHGKYRVERIIGEGGMGLVVAARHLTLDKWVALKLLSAKSRESEEALERFTREARAAAKIQSEHVGRVLDVDTLANGTPFIVMELLEGHDLAEELRQKQRVGVERAVTVVLQACEAIAEAHAAGVVHRDLKPANLFLSKTSTDAVAVKVLDFGISKVTRRESITEIDKALTNPSTMLGSPLYMSPEQMKASGDVDHRTDIWSLGVILYEEITGVSPFDATTVPMICASVLSLAPPKIEVEGVPEGLVKVILRCLEKEPANRYRDIGHLARALAPFAPAQAKITIDRIMQLKDADGAPAISPPSITPPPMREGAATVTSWGAKGVPAPRRKVLPIAVVGGLCAVILLAVGVRAWTSGGSTNPAASGAPPLSTVAAKVEEPAAPVQTSAPLDTASPTATASAEPVASATSSSGPAPAASSAPAYRPGTKWGGRPKGRTAGFGGRE
jgi:serine/threonine-protein kinase